MAKIFKIKRNIEPGIIKIFDMSLHLGEKTADGFLKKKFRVIGMQDED